jgi:hypothetical protein
MFDFIFELFGWTAASKIAENHMNEIKYQNFIVQGKNKEILTLKPSITGCENTLDKAYLDLYNYLIKKEIITSKINAAAVAMVSPINIINKDKTGEGILKDLVKEENSDFPETIKKCYTIDYDKLSKFLIDYKYDAKDELSYIYKQNGGSLKMKKKKTKTEKRKNQKSKNRRK